MEKPQTDLFFIDKVNYDNLQSKNFNINNLRNVFINFNDDCLSNITLRQILEINKKLSIALFNGDQYYIGYNKLSTQEENYVNYYAEDTLLNTETSIGDCAVVCSAGEAEIESKKYYEIIPLVNGGKTDLLVVVDRGFFTTLTESKNELLKFVLTCLGQQYKFGSSLKDLLNLYLNLKHTEESLSLIKLRMN